MKLTKEKLKQIIKEELQEMGAADMSTQQEAKWVDDMFAPRSKVEALQMGLDEVMALVKSIQATIEGGTSTENDIKKVLNKIGMAAAKAMDMVKKTLK